jgi:hypothetical protein
MKHATNCKFCKNPITLDVDDEYDAIGDPLKLLPLAACNRCADLRVERRSLERKVNFICMMRHLDPKIRESRMDHHRQMLESLLKQYANMIARWHGMSGMCWDDAALDDIMERPDLWNKNLQTLWKMFAENSKARAL